MVPPSWTFGIVSSLCPLQGSGVAGISGSQLKQEDPPNLSILLSGGKETNQDSPSKGD